MQKLTIEEVKEKLANGDKDFFGKKQELNKDVLDTKGWEINYKYIRLLQEIYYTRLKNGN